MKQTSLYGVKCHLSVEIVSIPLAKEDIRSQKWEVGRNKKANKQTHKGSTQWFGRRLGTKKAKTQLPVSTENFCCMYYITSPMIAVPNLLNFFVIKLCLSVLYSFWKMVLRLFSVKLALDFTKATHCILSHCSFQKREKLHFLKYCLIFIYF